MNMSTLQLIDSLICKFNDEKQLNDVKWQFTDRLSPIMKIHLKHFKAYRKTITLNVNKNDTVFNIKTKVQNIIDQPPEQQRIFYEFSQSKQLIQLVDSATLSLYNIKNEDNLWLKLKSPAKKRQPQQQRQRKKTKHKPIVFGTVKNVDELTNNLTQKYKRYKFKMRDPTTYKTLKSKPSMFDSIKNMESCIDIRNTSLEQDLIKMERQLIAKDAKKHISRLCRTDGCKTKAPQNYPNNVYLCDKCKLSFSKQLKCKISCDKGTMEDKQKCRWLKVNYEEFVNSIKISDRRQSFNKKHLYPKNYFRVAMAKLLCFQQQINNVNMKDCSKTQKTTMKQLKKITENLMKLLVAARQNLNDFWDGLFTFILAIISAFKITRADVVVGGNGLISGAQKIIEAITANHVYVAGLYACIAIMIGVIVYLLIFGDKSQRKIAGGALVGMGFGLGVGLGVGLAPVTGPLVLIGGAIGGGLVALFGS